MRFVLPLLLAAAGVAAFVAWPKPHALQTPKPATVSALQPHRAVYDLHLARVKSGAQVIGADGTMNYEWADACTGWAIQQKFNVTLYYTQGDPQEMKTNLATWEAKDGSAFQFNVMRATDGETLESFKGSAQLASNGTGVAHYILPEKNDVTLSTETVFPSWHTLHVLELAKKGERFFNKQVFDGADEHGTNDISAAIGAKRPWAGDTTSFKENARFLKGDIWPVSLAFYAKDNVDGVPDYELAMQLMDNGIAPYVTIDYGDFVLEATLKSLEPLPPC